MQTKVQTRHTLRLCQEKDKAIVRKRQGCCKKKDKAIVRKRQGHCKKKARLLQESHNQQAQKQGVIKRGTAAIIKKGTKDKVSNAYFP